MLFQLDKNCGKFREKALEHSDLLEQFFGGMTTTGKTQWTPVKDLPSMAFIDESNGSSDEASTNELGVGLGWQ